MDDARVACALWKKHSTVGGKAGGAHLILRMDVCKPLEVCILRAPSEAETQHGFADKQSYQLASLGVSRQDRPFYPFWLN